MRYENNAETKTKRKTTIYSQFKLHRLISNHVWSVASKTTKLIINFNREKNFSNETRPSDLIDQQNHGSEIPTSLNAHKTGHD